MLLEVLFVIIYCDKLGFNRNKSLPGREDFPTYILFLTLKIETSDRFRIHKRSWI